MNRKVRKKMEATTGQWIGEQCKNTEKAMMSGKQQRGLRQYKSKVVEDSSGNILTGSTAFLYRGTEYCSGLYS